MDNKHTQGAVMFGLRRTPTAADTALLAASLVRRYAVATIGFLTKPAILRVKIT